MIYKIKLLSLSFALALSLNNGMAMEDKVVNIYSNELPQKHLFFKENIPDDVYTEVTDTFKVIEGTKEIKYLLSRFSLEPWLKVPINEFFPSSGNQSSIHCFVNNNMEKTIFIDIKTPAFTSDLELASVKSNSNKLSTIQEKLAYPFELKFWDGNVEESNEMSWKYVDLALHNNFLLVKTENRNIDNEAFEILFKNISEFGLENTIIRIFIKRDKNNNQYQHYVLYDYEKEKSLETIQEFYKY